MCSLNVTIVRFDPETVTRGLCASLVLLASACGSESSSSSNGPGSTTTDTTTTGSTTGSTSDSTTDTSSTGTSGSTTSGTTTGGTSGGTGGTSTSGGATTGGTTSTSTTGSGGESTSSSTTGSVEPCAFDCVAQCVPWGGTEQPGYCEAATQCCEGATEPGSINPLAHLAASAEQVGLLLANRFNTKTLTFSSISELPPDGYKVACEWYGALGVASLTASQSLLNSLVAKFDPLKADFTSTMASGEAHVDRYIFGMVPLEIYLQTSDESYLPLGTQTADTQQTTNQTRGAIDDMFMMTGLQLEAYRATGDAKYIDFMATTMVDYLGAQQQNGLFFHNTTQAPVHWGRGNGWFAAGMAEIMRDLPESEPQYQTIETGYKRMMEGLLAVQSANGLWYQVLDLPDNPSNWEESSGSAMFTYAMIAGVRRGVLDADTYVPAIEAAWAGLQTKINAQGDVSDICEGTWYHATAAEYMALSRLTGDGHGQAPVLWAAAELLR